MRIAISEFLEEEQWPKNQVPQDLQNLLAQNNACYVLITCGHPTAEGQMHVEMTYGGSRSDACLAAYLIESARGFIEECDDDGSS